MSGEVCHFFSCMFDFSFAMNFSFSRSRGPNSIPTFSILVYTMQRATPKNSNRISSSGREVRVEKVGLSQGKRAKSDAQATFKKCQGPVEPPKNCLNLSISTMKNKKMHRCERKTKALRTSSSFGGQKARVCAGKQVHLDDFKTSEVQGKSDSVARGVSMDQEVTGNQRRRGGEQKNDAKDVCMCVQREVWR
jgi:hypothetical protein